MYTEADARFNNEDVAHSVRLLPSNAYSSVHVPMFEQSHKHTKTTFGAPNQYQMQMRVDETPELLPPAAQPQKQKTSPMLGPKQMPYQKEQQQKSVFTDKLRGIGIDPEHAKTLMSRAKIRQYPIPTQPMGK